MLVLLGVLSAGALIWLGRLILVYHFAARPTVLSAAGPDSSALRSESAGSPTAPAPRVTVIVPAKDEAPNIRRCVASLLAQDYPDLRVIVVDDRSADATAEIVAALAAGDGRLTLIRNRHLPEGWTGKCHALWLAAAQADGDWLLFTDGDTEHAPSAVAQAVAFTAERGVAFLTLLPAVGAEGFWERVLQPCLAGLLMSLFPPAVVNASRRRLAFANGQYILIRRDLYDQLGGHAAVRHEFLEDVALARRAKGRGERVCVAHGGEVLRTTMYHGLGAIWRGWSRIFFGSGRPAWTLVLLIVAAVLATVVPPLALVWAAAALAGRWTGGPVWAVLGLAALQVGLMMACMSRFYKLGQCDRRFLPLHPLATAIAVGIMANALRLRWFCRTITWRGTTYRQGSLRRVG